MIRLIDVAHVVAAAATQDPSGGSDFNWLTAILVPLIVASIPASIGVVVSSANRRDARQAAKEARESNGEIERLRLLERRVIDRKADAYGNFLPALAKALEPQAAGKTKAQESKQSADLLLVSNKFWHESLVYASDDVQRAFARAIQAGFHKAPAVVVIRLYGELVLAMRMDMWADASSLTSMDVWSPKLTDMFTKQWLPGKTVHEMFTMPFTDLCREAGWICPWAETPLDHHAGEQARLTRAPSNGR